MKLGDLFVGVELPQPLVRSDVEITSIAYNSREVRPGALFVAVRGEKTDGNRFVFDAIERGARAIASELPQPTDDSKLIPVNVEWIQVAQARHALATTGANFFGRPAEQLKLVGVTGTNGKTTTTY